MSFIAYSELSSWVTSNGSHMTWCASQSLSFSPPERSFMWLPERLLNVIHVPIGRNKCVFWKWLSWSYTYHMCKCVYIYIYISEMFDFDNDFITKSKDTVSWFPCVVLLGHPNSAQLTEPPLCHAAGSCAFTHATAFCQLTWHLPSLYVCSFQCYNCHVWSFPHTNISTIEIGLPDQSGGRRWSNSLPRTSIICAPAWKSRGTHKISVENLGSSTSIQQIL